MSTLGQRKTDRAWSFLHALGRKGLPAAVTVSGRTYDLHTFVKHDFYAATGFYADEAGRQIVVKFGRRHSPVGRLLVRRESCFYQKLHDLPAVPRWLGFVTLPGGWGFAHDFAPGVPLGDVPRGRPDDGGVPDTFFDELERTLRELHARGVAYVDLDKPWNVIVSPDGRPVLIDFQISLARRSAAGRLFFRAAVRGDLYHLLKHKSRWRPDLMSNDETARLARRTALVRLHRKLTRPWFAIRRPLMARLRRTGRLLPEGSK